MIPLNVIKSLIPCYLLAITNTLSAAEIHWVESKFANTPVKIVVIDVGELSHSDSVNPNAWKSWLNVFVIPEDTSKAATLAVLGSYTKSEDKITFTPRYPFSDRVTYRAVYKRQKAIPSGNTIITSQWNPDQSTKAPSTLVENIFPTSAVLPENLLKFYLTFSNPMSGGNVYEHIHLYNENDQEVELPFLELGEELWDTSMQRLTLFIDPGRIKRGVKPLEDIGPSLEAGKRFQLVIDKNWIDASGIPLLSHFEKEFRVTQPDRQSIAPDTWEILIPKEGSLQAVVIKFGESLDYALAQRVIAFISSDGMWVEGTTKLAVEETELHFIPNTAWSKGSYRIRIRTLLEDLAGNNVGKPFEVDVFDQIEKRIQSKYVERVFSIH